MMFVSITNLPGHPVWLCWCPRLDPPVFHPEKEYHYDNMIKMLGMKIHLKLIKSLQIQFRKVMKTDIDIPLM